MWGIRQGDARRMSGLHLKAIAVALVVYATALLCMGAALFVGLHAVGTGWALDMPAMYVLHLAAWAMGVAWAGYYYRLSGVAAWFTIAGGAGLVVLVLLMSTRYPELLIAAGVCAVLALSLVHRLPRLGPRASPDGTAWPRQGDGFAVGAAADADDVAPIACHACGALVRGAVCEACGTPVTPSVRSTIIAGALLRPRLALGVVVGFLLAPIAIVQYVLSPEGQGDALLVGVFVAGPLVIVGLAWYGYRRWYRRRYPDG